MFYYIPPSSLPSSYSYSPAPRDRYLAALAEVKAAKSEFLAAEAAQREEDQLRRRLQEIQYREQDQLFRSPYDRIPATQTYPSYEGLSSYYQQVEAEERLSLIALREADIAERRRQVEASRPPHKEALHRRQHHQRQQARLSALLDQSVKVAQHHCPWGNQASQPPPSCRTSCHKPRQQSSRALHPILQAFLHPEAQVAAPVKPKPQVKHVVEAFLQQVSGAQPETKQSKAQREPAFVPHQFLGELIQSLHSQQVQQSASHAVSPSFPEQQFAKQIADLFLPPAGRPSTGSSPSRAASASSLKPAQEASAQTAPAPAEEPSNAPNPAAASLKEEELEARLHNESHSEVRDTIQAIFASLRDADDYARAEPSPKASTSDKASDKASDKGLAPESTAASLKEELEARFNNESHSEVRDTIQAIFASLQDVDNYARAEPSPKASSSGKGKAKAEARPAASSTDATSKDVVDALNEVRSIDAFFHTLESDFTFPATLDFITAHLVPQNGRPAPSDSESSSATINLAYTSRNQPLRVYEQTLGALLGKLNSVESFGDVCASRKEEALEDLKREVEGSYMTRLDKEDKVATPSEPISGADATTQGSVDEPFVSLSPSSATIKGYEVHTDDTISPAQIESADAFISAATEADPDPGRRTNKDSNDWSEVEA